MKVSTQFLKNRRISGAILLSFLMTMLLSCDVQEGPGGSSSISGRIFVNNYNSEFTQLRASYYGPEEDVYLVYGEEAIYGDDMKTHHDGRFRFDYLRKGTYTIYAYSKDSTGTIPAEVFPEMIEVEITNNNQQVDIGDIVILK